MCRGRWALWPSRAPITSYQTGGSSSLAWYFSSYGAGGSWPCWPRGLPALPAFALPVWSSFRALGGSVPLGVSAPTRCYVSPELPG